MRCIYITVLEISVIKLASRIEERNLTRCPGTWHFTVLFHLGGIFWGMGFECSHRKTHCYLHIQSFVLWKLSTLKLMQFSWLSFCIIRRTNVVLALTGNCWFLVLTSCIHSVIAHTQWIIHHPFDNCPLNIILSRLILSYWYSCWNHLPY